MVLILLGHWLLLDVLVWYCRRWLPPDGVTVAACCWMLLGLVGRQWMALPSMDVTGVDGIVVA